jgi:hypothetical protein
MNEAGSPGDECSSSAMRTASDQTYRSIGDGEKIDDADRGHAAAALGPDNWPHGDRGIAPPAKGVAEIGMHGNDPSGFLLGGEKRSSIYRTRSKLSRTADFCKSIR